jgi:hypothetical protein
MVKNYLYTTIHRKFIVAYSKKMDNIVTAQNYFQESLQARKYWRNQYWIIIISATELANLIWSVFWSLCGVRCRWLYWRRKYFAAIFTHCQRTWTVWVDHIPPWTFWRWCWKVGQKRTPSALNKAHRMHNTEKNF